MQVKTKFTTRVKRGTIGKVVSEHMVAELCLKLFLVDFGYMTIWFMERDVEVIE
ncbi:hypothetical protein WOSG25_290040 [Weissella oryzae SG25]|uniref:Uncharacterized protein n=1 Tax=Weissella oryzae (strain DSM 25784 / JCM 18191 / LMG 30913 / SG25) TaxID=1329250 RepID=A0A069CW83_WEIOS|nr:hypothetical protein [Weissella oryzae]GAK32070.1 hypothetical protein WOSG25_290040 [Weissella oryzae SG25]